MNYREYKRQALTPNADPATVEAGVLAIRSEMIDTLSQLEDRLSPRKVFDLIMQRGRAATGGPSQFVSNLGEVVRDNPVSVVLLVGGAASLLNAERRAARPRLSEHTEVGERAGELAEQTRRGLGERAHEVRERAQERAQGIRERAHDAGQRAQAKRAELQGRARETFTSARELGRRSLGDVRSRGERMIHEEPLLLAGIGLALGAIAGARVRLTEREQRVFEASRQPEPSGKMRPAETQRDVDSDTVVQRAAAAIERDEPVTSRREIEIEEERRLSTIVEGAVPPDPNPGPPSTGGRNL